MVLTTDLGALETGYVAGIGGMAGDAFDALIVSDYANGDLERFDRVTGTFEGIIGKGNFVSPYGIAIQGVPAPTGILALGIGLAGLTFRKRR